MVASFNVTSDKGLGELNQYLADRSYIDGYQASSADVAVFKALSKAPEAGKHAHVSRWYNHINAFAENERSSLRQVSAPSFVEEKGEKKEEEEVDLFGDDEEEDAEYERQLEERKKAAIAAKGGKEKEKPIAKSSLLIDVKPWDDETQMDKLEECVRSIQMDGLTWGASKLVPVGYGIKKLAISAVVVDDLVSIDDLEEKIVAFEDYVQSMDVAASDHHAGQLLRSLAGSDGVITEHEFVHGIKRYVEEHGQHW